MPRVWKVSNGRKGGERREKSYTAVERRDGTVWCYWDDEPLNWWPMRGKKTTVRQALWFWKSRERQVTENPLDFTEG
jgi:hypothetical protein